MTSPKGRDELGSHLPSSNPPFLEGGSAHAVPKAAHARSHDLQERRVTPEGIGLFRREGRQALHLQRRQCFHDLQGQGMHLEQDLVIPPPMLAEIARL